MLKKIKKFFKAAVSLLLKTTTDILLIIGFILVAVGVFKIFIPAGYIISGLSFIIFAFFIAKKGG